MCGETCLSVWSFREISSLGKRAASRCLVDAGGGGGGVIFERIPFRRGDNFVFLCLRTPAGVTLYRLPRIFGQSDLGS